MTGGHGFILDYVECEWNFRVATFPDVVRKAYLVLRPGIVLVDAVHDGRNVHGPQVVQKIFLGLCRLLVGHIRGLQLVNESQLSNYDDVEPFHNVNI
jgi:hypothetical protein